MDACNSHKLEQQQRMAGGGGGGGGAFKSPKGIRKAKVDEKKKTSELFLYLRGQRRAKLTSVTFRRFFFVIKIDQCQKNKDFFLN